MASTVTGATGDKPSLVSTPRPTATGFPQAIPFTVALVAGVLTLDLLTPSDWAVVPLYLTSLYIASRALTPWWPVFLGGVCIAALVIPGYLLSSAAGARALLNRLAGAILLSLAIWIFLRARRNEELLRDANEWLARDIAAREQAEKLVRESEARYRHIVDHANDIIYRTDAHGRFTFVNPTATRLLKYPEQELIGRHYLELIRPDYRHAAERFYRRQFLKRIGNTYYEFPALAKSGEEMWFGQNVQLVTEGDGVVGFQAIVRDITERKRMEEERQQLVSLVEHSNDFIGLATLDGRTIYVNEAGRRMVGLDTLEDVRRTVVTDYFLPHHQPTVRDQILPLVIREGRWGGEIPFRHFQTGEAIPVYWNVFLITDPDTKQPMALACVSPDLTQRKRAEQALQERERQLRRLLEERERLSEDLHDNIIQMLYATGIQLEECRRLAGPDAQEVGRHLDAAIKALNAVIRDVRNYVIGDERDAANGERLLAALQDLAGMIAEPHGLHVHLHADPSAAHRLTPEQSKHVLHVAREAMSNTVRHARAKNAVLSLEMINGDVCLKVEDDGRGFDPGGAVESGRGLVNMRTRAEKLGAKLQVTSRRGNGTRIVLLIPPDPEHASA